MVILVDWLHELIELNVSWGFRNSLERMNFLSDFLFEFWCHSKGSRCTYLSHNHQFLVHNFDSNIIPCPSSTFRMEWSLCVKFFRIISTMSHFYRENAGRNIHRPFFIPLTNLNTKKKKYYFLCSNGWVKLTYFFLSYGWGITFCVTSDLWKFAVEKPQIDWSVGPRNAFNKVGINKTRRGAVKNFRYESLK